MAWLTSASRDVMAWLTSAGFLWRPRARGLAGSVVVRLFLEAAAQIEDWILGIED